MTTRLFPIGSKEWRDNFSKKHGNKTFYHDRKYHNGEGYYKPNFLGDSEITFEQMMESQRLAQLALQDFEERREKTLTQIRAGK